MAKTLQRTESVKVERRDSAARVYFRPYAVDRNPSGPVLFRSCGSGRLRETVYRLQVEACRTGKET